MQLSFEAYKKIISFKTANSNSRVQCLTNKIKTYLPQSVIFHLLENGNTENYLILIHQNLKQKFFGSAVTKFISTEVQYLIIKLRKKNTENMLFLAFLSLILWKIMKLKSGVWLFFKKPNQKIILFSNTNHVFAKVLLSQTK